MRPCLQAAAVVVAVSLVGSPLAAQKLVAPVKGNAKVEGDRILTGAKAEIDQEVNRAKEGLRQQVSQLAVAGAEKILRREIDAKAHSDMLTAIANEL